MKRSSIALLGATMLASLAGCGEMVEVPPASVGIVKDKDGYVGNFIPPSAFRLPVCLIDPCPTPVFIHLQHAKITEQMDVFLPSSNMQIDDIEVNLVAGIRNDQNSLNAVLTKISPKQIKDGSYWISFDQVYQVYVKERVRAVVREAVAAKNLEWLLKNREAYGREVFANLNDSLRKLKSPVETIQFSFAKLNPPPVIRKALEAAKEREVDLQKTEAQMQLDIKKSEARLEVAKRDAAVRLEKARAFKAEAEAMARAVTPQWLAMRRLEVMEELAKSNSAVFVPMDMNPAETGLLKLGVLK